MGAHGMTIVLRIAVVALAACAAACGPKGAPVETGPGSVEAGRRFLEGRWGLVSFDVFPPNRAPIAIKGDGSLTYDEFGNLAIDIRVDDPVVARELEFAGIPLTNGRIQSSGRAVLDMQARMLTYILEGQPALVSTAPAGPLAFTRPRYWELNGNTVTLTTRGDDGKPASVGRWQKVP
jgi:hypothetical protein